MKEEKNDRIYIGKLFRQVLDKQKESVKDVTYEVVEITDNIACEMIAKKIMKGLKVF